jgi:hypothetical protein
MRNTSCASDITNYRIKLVVILCLRKHRIGFLGDKKAHARIHGDDQWIRARCGRFGDVQYLISSFHFPIHESLSRHYAGVVSLVAFHIRKRTHPLHCLSLREAPLQPLCSEYRESTHLNASYHSSAYTHEWFATQASTILPAMIN